MNNGYTPDHDAVCDAWASRYDGEHTGATGAERRGYEAEFDRFIAAIKAEAWDEGYNAGELCGLTAEQSDHACPINPYRSEDVA